MSLLQKLLGRDGASQLSIDPTHFAARVSPRPLHGAGHYRVSVATAIMNAAQPAGSHFFQFKWTSVTHLALITRLRARFHPLTPFTAATLTDHGSVDAFIARPFGGGGSGTTLTLTGNNAKMRSSMAAAQAIINVSVSTALTVATGLDTQPFAQSIQKGNRINPAAATEEIVMPVADGLNFQANVEAGEHPIVLATTEGVIIRNRTIWPAAGTGIYIFECAWAELLIADY